ncbi:hypothetical protein [Vibrio cyclitrophicus]|uniref:hypothetical protein n=1 Tax=Vibrio cyclitrophicus TaxID=47951 RepID=UPI0011B806CD|nr:hypothetical protein [Vibrio cyclitrophicus]
MKRISVVLLTFSTLVMAKESQEPVITSSQTNIPPHSFKAQIVEMPDYQRLFGAISSNKNDIYALKVNLLNFYSSLLPVLRYEALVLEIPEALTAYSSAESASYELAKLHMTDPNSVEPGEYQFYERVVLEDSYEIAKELVLNVLPLIPTTESITKQSVVSAEGKPQEAIHHETY